MFEVFAFDCDTRIKANSPLIIPRLPTMLKSNAISAYQCLSLASDKHVPV